MLSQFAQQSDKAKGCNRKMNNYVKSIDIKLNVDESETAKQFKDTLNKLQKDIGVDFRVNKDSLKGLGDELSKQLSIKSEIADLENKLSSLHDINTSESKQAQDWLRKAIDERKKLIGLETSEEKKQREEQDKKDDKHTQRLNNFVSALYDIRDSFLEKLTSAFKDAWKELENMLNYSLLSNSHTRDLAFTYGFSASEAYGFDKAKQVLGISSDEDLMYMNSDQQRMFQNAMTKYAQKYSELYDSGMFEKMLEFQVEMEEFKTDVQLELVQFFMDNKDTIMTAMKAIISLAEFLVKALGWIIDGLSGGGKNPDDVSSKVSDVISSYTSNNNNSRTYNVTVDTTYNHVTKADQQFLSNAGTMTYEQVMRTIQGL